MKTITPILLWDFLFPFILKIMPAHVAEVRLDNPLNSLDLQACLSNALNDVLVGGIELAKSVDFVCRKPRFVSRL